MTFNFPCPIEILQPSQPVVLVSIPGVNTAVAAPVFTAPVITPTTQLVTPGRIGDVVIIGPGNIDIDSGIPSSTPSTDEGTF